MSNCGMTALSAFGVSDPGLVRGHNEDSFAVDDEENLYVVADGMGGHSYGEIASRISVRSICEFIRQKAGIISTKAFAAA